ncbi:MAG: EamA family transporter [Ruminococcus sp.]|nr:EamA family transporter [Ruminococcus sp.]
MWKIRTVFYENIGSINADSVMILFYLSFVSVAAYSLWLVLLKYNPVSKLAVFGFMNPICCVIISGIVLKESNSLGI